MAKNGGHIKPGSTVVMITSYCIFREYKSKMLVMIKNILVPHHAKFQ